MSEEKPLRSIAWTALLLSAAILLRYHPHLSTDGAILEHDWYTMHQVDAIHVAKAASEGALTATWSPWILGGTPLFGVATKPFSYPPFLVAVIALGPAFAMNALLFVHLLVGGVGTVLLARRLGLEGVAPAVCGALFVLARFPASGFVSTPFAFGYAVAWWPLTMVFVLDLLEGVRPVRAGTWIGALVAAQWHAGGEPSLYWLACFVAAFSLPYLARRWSGRELRAFGSGSALALFVFAGLVAVKVLPELAWLDASGRGEPLGVEVARDPGLEEGLERIGTDNRLVGFGRLAAEEYDGRGGWTIAVGLVLGAVVGWRRRAWWGLVLGTALCYGLASGALHEWAYDLLPGYDRMRRHTRFIMITGFGAILLAGHGLRFRVRGGGRELAVRVGAAVALAVAVLFDTGSVPWLRTERVLGSPAERVELARAELVPVLSDPRHVRLHHPSHRDQPLWVTLGIESTGGALGGPRSGNALYHEVLGEFESAAELEWGASGALDVLNVGYLAAYRDFSNPGLVLVSSRRDLSAETLAGLRDADARPIRLYRRLGARARACLVDAPTLVVGVPEARRASILRAIRAPSFDARTTVFVEPANGALELTPAETEGFGAIVFAGRGPEDSAVRAWSASRSGGEVSIGPGGDATWRPTGVATRVQPLEAARFQKTMRTIEVDVSDRRAGFLVLAEVATLHPGWTARIDGEAAELYRADGVVTLLRLPPDARRVRLEYRPPGMVAGAWITGATIALLLAAAVAARRRDALGSLS